MLVDGAVFTAEVSSADGKARTRSWGAEATRRATTAPNHGGLGVVPVRGDPSLATLPVMGIRRRLERTGALAAIGTWASVHS